MLSERGSQLDIFAEYLSNEVAYPRVNFIDCLKTVVCI